VRLALPLSTLAAFLISSAPARLGDEVKLRSSKIEISTG